MIELVALLRIIPFILVMVIAWEKGFKWLTLVSIWVTVVAILNYLFAFSAEVRAILGSVFSFLLLLHVLDLKNRRAK